MAACAWGRTRGLWQMGSPGFRPTAMPCNGRHDFKKMIRSRWYRQVQNPVSLGSLAGMETLFSMNQSRS